MSFRPSLQFLFWTFLKIGSTAFGGLMSLISVVEKVVVEQLKLLTHKDILDGISLAAFLPGPIATNVVAYIGYRLRGGWGSFVTLAGVILPSFVLIVGLAIAYSNVGTIPAINKVFLGFIPAVTAIIVSTAWQMSLKEIKGWREAYIAVISALLLLRVGGAYLTILIIFCSGLAGWLLFGRPRNTFEAISKKQYKPSLKLQLSAVFLLLCALLAYIAPSLILEKYTLLKIFATFAGISVMLFGGAYVGIPLMQEIVVHDHSWLTQQEFSYAIALGQITPGPIVISAAFIGYKVGGILGALVATIGIFYPPSLLMVTSTELLERVKESPDIQAALRGIRPAVIGMIFAAASVVGKTAPLHWISLAVFIASLFALVRLRVNVMWIIPTAGLVSLFLEQ